MKPCPTDCGRSCPDGQVMCIECCGLVPLPLQGELRAAWRTYHHRVQKVAAGSGFRDGARHALQGVRALERMAVFSALEQLIHMELRS